MKTWIVDTGPLVALLVANDGRHEWAVEQCKSAPTTVLTCEAVLAEMLFLLKREGHDPGLLFALMEAGFVRVGFDLQREYASVRELMRRYAAQPMSLADACLVRLAEQHPEAAVWTLNRDFRIYRKNRRQTLSLISPW